LKQEAIDMKTKAVWGSHLKELVSARMDTMVYAMQWARDPRSMQTGTHHRRIGTSASESVAVCRLWASSLQSWK
jgi:hypothetical protein